MNTLKNRVQLIGNLGADQEVKTFESNKKKARFSLATTESYKDQEGKLVKDTQWHNVIAWSKQADFAEKYMKKGQEIAVEGKLTTRSYEDNDGNKKYITEVIASEFMLLRRPQE